MPASLMTGCGDSIYPAANAPRGLYLQRALNILLVLKSALKQHDVSGLLQPFLAGHLYFASSSLQKATGQLQRRRVMTELSVPCCSASAMGGDTRVIPALPGSAENGFSFQADQSASAHLLAWVPACPCVTVSPSAFSSGPTCLHLQNSLRVFLQSSFSRGGFSSRLFFLMPRQSWGTSPGRSFRCSLSGDSRFPRGTLQTALKASTGPPRQARSLAAPTSSRAQDH